MESGASVAQTMHLWRRCRACARQCICGADVAQDDTYVVEDDAVDLLDVAGVACFAIHVDSLDGKLPDAGEYNVVH